MRGRGDDGVGIQLPLAKVPWCLTNAGEKEPSEGGRRLSSERLTGVGPGEGKSRRTCRLMIEWFLGTVIVESTGHWRMRVGLMYPLYLAEFLAEVHACSLGLHTVTG